LEGGERERRLRVELLLELGKLYQNLDRWPQAAGVLEQALGLFRQVGDRLGEANVYYSMAKIDMALDDVDAAKRYLDQALALHMLIGDRYREARDRNYRSDILVALGEVTQAREDLSFALEVYTALDLPYADGVAAKLEDLA
jgi:tetratricopeptide (TPR) repeat protein